MHSFVILPNGFLHAYSCQANILTPVLRWPGVTCTILLDPIKILSLLSKKEKEKKDMTANSP